jgi:HD-like signal output (HDOD) protein
MLTRLLLLIIVVALVIAVWLFVRAAKRRRPPAARAIECNPPTLSSSSDQEPNGLSSDAVFIKLHELAFGATQVEPPLAPEQRKFAATISMAINTAAAEPAYAPRRPLLLPQLLRALNDSESSHRELAAIIARDPALAGNLLKLANSAFYRVKAQPVESVDRAVTILGIEGMRSLIAAAVLQPVFRIAGGEFPRFPEVTWEHALRAATAAEAHAAFVEGSDPFAAQLLGLMMGLGEIIVFRIALDQYAGRKGQRPDASVIALLLDTQTAAVARRIANSWGLTERILTALDDQSPQGRMRTPSSLGQSLRMGRLAGALSVLNAHGRVDESAVKASMLTSGFSASEFERIWARLSVRA